MIKINPFEHLPEDTIHSICSDIWAALEAAGVSTSDDSEISIRVYDWKGE